MSDGNPMTLDIITALTRRGRWNRPLQADLPLPLSPLRLSQPPPPEEESILEAIQRTGELRIAMRRDAVPFGYADNQDNWSGYCPTLALSLRDYVRDRLQQDITIELVELPSTLDNRFDLVRDGNVYLECGPNSIRTGVDGIVFFLT